MRSQVVEDYLNAILKSLQNCGESKYWPVAPGQVDAYFEDLLSVEFFDKFKEDSDKFKTALSTIPPHILRWFFLPFTVLGLKVAREFNHFNITGQEIISLIEATHEVLKSQVSSDPFSLDNQNLICKPEELKEKISKLYWLNKSVKKSVNFLSIDLESFVWSIDFDIYAYGVYWHGPYRISDGDTVLIKSFTDLNSPIWGQKVPYKNISIYYYFKSRVDAKIDFMNHIIYRSDIWNDLDKIAVKVDSRSLTNEEEIGKIDDYFVTQRKIQLDIINQMKPENFIQKGADIYYYMFKPFFDYYRQDWRPTKEFHNCLKRWGNKFWDEYESNNPSEKKLPDSFFMKMYDPRNDFVG